MAVNAPEPEREPPRWMPVGQASEWPAQGGRLVQIGARRIAVYHCGEAWYALKDACPHAGVSLARGQLQEATVTCLGHGWSFDLVTGAVVRGGAGYRATVYPVRVLAGVVEIGV